MADIKNKYPFRASRFLYGLITVGLCLVFQLAQHHAAYASTFTNSHFIDNSLFLDANAMSPDSIQAFLDSKSGTLKSSSFLLDCDVAGATAKRMYQAIGAPCGQTVSAAKIIYYVAQVYGVNPKVILATMQKEQSLVTNPSPTARAYNQAMGYDCPDSGECSAASNFFYQIDNGAWALRYHYERANGNKTWWNTSSWTCGSPKNYYTPNLYPRQNVTFYDDNATAYTTVFIDNAATSSFYCYTPHAYNNPQGLYGRDAFGTTGQYYSGSYNFVYYYELWFGSTYAYTYNNLSYSNVFDADFYRTTYPDIRQAYGNNDLAAFNHFITYGMREGRQGSQNFDVNSYRTRYQDLRSVFGTDLPAYYQHFITNGLREGRIATGDATLVPITTYQGVDYSSIYDFNTYKANYPDIAKTFANDDTGAIKHFVMNGMDEGRIASTSFNVNSYKSRYYDLRRSFGGNTKAYYIHYLLTGKAEGRIATGTYLGGTTVLNGVDYSSVYDFNTYENTYPDIKSAFGLDDIAALQHFVYNGMREGRQAISSFNVSAYKARYPDLQAAFGNNTQQYYIHFIQSGKKEGRIGN